MLLTDIILLLLLLLALLAISDAFQHNVHSSSTALIAFRPLSLPPHHSTASFDWALKVSELHIPGYRETKKHFISDHAHNPGEEFRITQEDYKSLLPYRDGYLIHKTNGYLFTNAECESMVQEAEDVASKMGWTTTRHGVGHVVHDIHSVYSNVWSTHIIIDHNVCLSNSLL